MLIMTVAILTTWFRNVDSFADSGSPEGLRSEQWHNKNVCLEGPGRWAGEACVPAAVQRGGGKAGERHDTYLGFSTNLGRCN